MPAESERYQFNLGIQGNEAIQTLRAILAQMRELNRTSVEILSVLRSVSEGMRNMAQATSAAAEELHKSNAATRQAAREAARMAREKAAEAEAFRRAAAAAMEYINTIRSMGMLPSSAPLLLGPGESIAPAIAPRPGAVAPWIQRRQPPLLPPPSAGAGGGGARWGGGAGWGGGPGIIEGDILEGEFRELRPSGGRDSSGLLRGWMYHLQWFVEGTVIYLGISTVINGVRDSMRQLLDVTKAQSAAQVELNLSMSMSTEEFQKQDAAVRGLLQTVGVGAQERMGLFREAARVSDSADELRALVSAGGYLSALTGQPAADAIDKLQDIMHQYNLEASQAMLVTDALAYAARRGTDSMSEYADAFSRSGAALRTAGYSFEESVGLLVGLTNAIDRGGTQLGTFIQQVFTLNQAEIERLRSVGIEPTGRDIRSVFEEAAAMFPSATQAQQRAILGAFGGTRFQGDVRTMIESYGQISRYMQEAINMEGEATRRADQMGMSLQRAGERSAAAWQNLLQTFSQAIHLQEILMGMAKESERIATRPVLAREITQLPPEQQAELYRRLQGAITGGDIWSRMTRGSLETYRQIVGMEGPIGSFLRLLGAYDITSRMPVEMQREVRRLMQEVSGMGAGTRGAAAGVAREAAPILEPMELLTLERFTQEQARAFQDAVAEIDEAFRRQGFEPGETIARQILVGEGRDFHLETIASSSVAMEMYLREIRDQGRQLQGVWNLPGRAMVPMESLDFMLAQPQRAQGLPSELPVPEQKGMTGPGVEPRLLLPPILKGAGGGVSPTIAGEDKERPVVSSRIEIPLIMKGEKMAEATADIQGDAFNRLVVSGAKLGGKLPPAILGVF